MSPGPVIRLDCGPLVDVPATRVSRLVPRSGMQRSSPAQKLPPLIHLHSGLSALVSNPDANPRLRLCPAGRPAIPYAVSRVLQAPNEGCRAPQAPSQIARHLLAANPRRSFAAGGIRRSPPNPASRPGRAVRFVGLRNQV